MSTRRPRAGFSAEELIVVLGIITLLVLGFLWLTRHLPSAARMTSCASNLRQLSQASRMYMADNSGSMPTDAEPAVALNEYVNNEQVFNCPAVRREVRQERRAATEGQFVTEYDFATWARSDDPAQALVMRDSEPNRHLRRTWIGARLDGAIQRFGADEWDARWKEVTDDDAAQHR